MIRCALLSLVCLSVSDGAACMGSTAVTEYEKATIYSACAQSGDMASKVASVKPVQSTAIQNPPWIIDFDPLLIIAGEDRHGSDWPHRWSDHFTDPHLLQRRGRRKDE